MARTSQLVRAKDEVLSLFSQASEKIYSAEQLRQILLTKRKTWRLPESTSTSRFISFLKKHGELEAHELRSKHYDRSIIRYSWGEPSRLELAQSINPRGYLCHATAVLLHGLTKRSSKTIYLNIEQSPKPSTSSSLTQRAIDLAFSGPQRQSKLIYEYKGIEIVVIAGKNTDRLCVEEIIGPAAERLPATNLERTLIDIVVRPAYAGGISEVIKAYEAAKNRISTDRLLTTLKTLDYTYPYHQAIGYLMQRTGHPEQSYGALRTLGLSHDFYLAHGMQQPEYSQEWRLFHPRG